MNLKPDLSKLVLKTSLAALAHGSSEFKSRKLSLFEDYSSYGKSYRRFCGESIKLSLQDKIEKAEMNASFNVSVSSLSLNAENGLSVNVSGSLTSEKNLEITYNADLNSEYKNYFLLAFRRSYFVKMFKVILSTMFDFEEHGYKDGDNIDILQPEFPINEVCDFLMSNFSYLGFSENHMKCILYSASGFKFYKSVKIDIMAPFMDNDDIRLVYNDDKFQMYRNLSNTERARVRHTNEWSATEIVRSSNGVITESNALRDTIRNLHNRDISLVDIVVPIFATSLQGALLSLKNVCQNRSRARYKKIRVLSSVGYISMPEEEIQSVGDFPSWLSLDEMILYSLSGAKVFFNNGITSLDETKAALAYCSDNNFFLTLAEMMVRPEEIYINIIKDTTYHQFVAYDQRSRYSFSMHTNRTLSVEEDSIVTNAMNLDPVTYNLKGKDIINPDAVNSEIKRVSEALFQQMK